MGSFLPVLWPMRMPTLLLWQTERMSHPNAGRTFFPSLATRTVSPPPLVAQVPREGGRQQLTCPLTVDRWLLWNSPAGLVENPSVRPEGESPILAPMHRGVCVCVCVCVWVSECEWDRGGQWSQSSSFQRNPLRLSPGPRYGRDTHVSFSGVSLWRIFQGVLVDAARWCPILLVSGVRVKTSSAVS